MIVQTINKIITNIFFWATIVIVCIAVFYKNPNGEANKGSFDVEDFNTGWTMEISDSDDKETEIELPHVVTNAFKKTAIIHNVLPKNLDNGMRLCLRATMEDVSVYIDGQMRESYSSDKDSYAGYYTPSAYLLVDLNRDDAGKNIEIKYLMKREKSNIEQISIGYGNNAWFGIIANNIVEAVAAIVMIIMGFLALVMFTAFDIKYSINKTLFYLGQSMVMVGIWIISESKIRQLLLGSPSISGIFCYLSIEICGVFLVYYFDEVQDKKYHNIYCIIGTLILLQAVANVVLFATGIAQLHETLKYSHLWILIGILSTVVLLIVDAKKGRIKKYSFTAVGILILLISAIVEIAAVYLSDVQLFGIYLCIGLIIMLVTTTLQMFADIYRKERDSREHIQKSTLSTIETIASSIDAKDEYTGGHSERVAHYSKILAKYMRDQYKISNSDIVRIHYIALMHDIGKIGVPDAILNKAGKLTNDEFQLMKRHAIIGSDMLKEIDTIEGLQDGVRHHHERYDGKGYPDGLKGEEIPLIARILCLADCYDAMTSNRVYRTRLTDEQVRNEIERCAGSQFDPKLAKLFCELLDSGKLKPKTYNGFDAKSDGTLMKSSVLRYLLAMDKKEDKNEISSPAFVRMISYIVKMAEKQDKSVNIYLVENTDRIDSAISDNMSLNDISIEYSVDKRLVVWFDLDAATANLRIANIRKVLGDVKVEFEDLSKQEI